MHSLEIYLSKEYRMIVREQSRRRSARREEFRPFPLLHHLECRNLSEVSL